MKVFSSKIILIKAINWISWGRKLESNAKWRITWYQEFLTLSRIIKAYPANKLFRLIYKWSLNKEHIIV
jgi:hypothetical protein